MDKLILSENDMIKNIHLSGVQKAILTKIVAAATPEVAYEQISDGRNFVAARDILTQLKIISIEDEVASITDIGKQAMKDENLMDDSEQLTPDGQKYVEADNPNEIDTDSMGDAGAAAGPGDMPGAPGAAPEDDMGLGGEEGMGDEFGEEKPPGEDDEDDLSKAFESSLIKSINTAAKELNESDTVGVVDKSTTK